MTHRSSRGRIAPLPLATAVTLGLLVSACSSPPTGRPLSRPTSPKRDTDVVQGLHVSLATGPFFPVATSTTTPTLAPDQQALIAEKAKQPVWTPAPAGPAETVYPGVGVRFTPTSGATKLSATQALAVVTRQNSPFARTTGAPIIQLARFTDDDLYGLNLDPPRKYPRAVERSSDLV
jgi:hypothetical protein